MFRSLQMTIRSSQFYPSAKFNTPQTFHYKAISIQTGERIYQWNNFVKDISDNSSDVVCIFVVVVLLVTTNNTVSINNAATIIFIIWKFLINDFLQQIHAAYPQCVFSGVVQEDFFGLNTSHIGCIDMVSCHCVFSGDIPVQF